MNRKRVFTWGAVLILVLIAVLVSVQAVVAQTGPQPTREEILAYYPNMQSTSYALYWDVVGKSSGVMASTGYFLRSTLGQNAIGTSTSASYSLHAGFWQMFYNYLYMPTILR
jgi:uncharacterized membrane protein